MRETIRHHYFTFCTCDNSGIVGYIGGAQIDIKLIRVKQSDSIIYLDDNYFDFTDINNIFKE